MKRSRAQDPEPVGHDDWPLTPHPPTERRAHFYQRDLRRCEQAWKSGSIPALVDALIFCHQSERPLPLWLTRGAITLIKMLFEGKSLQKRGRLAKATTRYRSYMQDLSRWDAVRELEERREEILTIIRDYTDKDRDRWPNFAALAHDYSLEQRCAAAAERLNDRKGSAATFLRSYKKVQRDLKRGKIGPYYVPSYDNPLRRLC